MELTGIIRTFIALGIGIFLGAGIGYLFFPHIRDYFDKKGAEKRKIVELLAARKKVSVNEIAKYLDVSSSLAEQELQELERRGVARRLKNTGNDIEYENTAAR